MAVLSKAYEGMTEEQRQEMLETLRIQKLPGGGGPVTVAAFQTAVQATGFAPYKLAVIVANGTANVVLGHGLAFAANRWSYKGAGSVCRTHRLGARRNMGRHDPSCTCISGDRSLRGAGCVDPTINAATTAAKEMANTP